MFDLPTLPGGRGERRAPSADVARPRVCLCAPERHEGRRPRAEKALRPESKLARTVHCAEEDSPTARARSKATGNAFGPCAHQDAAAVSIGTTA
jgi:hypothetical protein